MFLVEMLSNAGIVVECMTENSHEERMYEFVQIINSADVDVRMDREVVPNMESVKLCDKEDMHGFQVKLNGSLMWKLKVMNENKDHHYMSRARSARHSTSDPSLIFNNQELHEIYVPCGGEMYSTIAVSNTVVVTVLFEVDDTDTCTWEKVASGDLPPIMQRRIDMIFHNRFCARLQVRVLRSAFCVLRSVFCVLCSVFCVLYCSADAPCCSSQTVFMDLLDAEDTELDAHELKSNASYAADEKHWVALANAPPPGRAEGDSWSSEVNAVGLCLSPSLKNFLDNQYGKREKFEAWVKKPAGFLASALARRSCSVPFGTRVLCCALRLTQVLFVPCSDYLGAAQASGNTSVWAKPPQLDETIDEFTYGQFDKLKNQMEYHLQHEPLFLTTLHVNRHSGEKVDIAVSDTLSFKANSLPVMNSISAFVISNQTQQNAKAAAGSRRKQPEPAQGGAAAQAQARQVRIPSKTTDPSWKGAWQNILNKLKVKDDDDEVPPIDIVTKMVVAFHGQVQHNKFTATTSLPPFKKVLAVEHYRHLVDEDDSTLQQSVKGWIAQVTRDKTRGGTGGGTAVPATGKRPRSVAIVEETEDALLEEVEDALLLNPLKGDIAPLKGVVDTHTQSIAKLQDGVKQNSTAIGTHDAAIEQNRVDIAQLRKQCDEKGGAAANDAVLCDKVHKLEKKAEQQATLLGSMGTAMQLTRVLLQNSSQNSGLSQSGSQSSSAPSTSLVDQLTDPLYKNMIYLVNDVFQWDNRDKLQFYGAVQQIDMFKEEYKKLVSKENGSS